jgi:hypothetical protein
MNTRLLVAVLLIVVGCVALAYGGISYTRRKTVVDIGPLQVQQDKRETIPLPPLLGAVALGSGVLMLVWRRHA